MERRYLYGTRFFAVLALLFALGVHYGGEAQAQIAAPEMSASAYDAFSPEFAVGVRAGLQRTALYGGAVTPGDPGTRLSGGVFMTYRFSPYLSLQPEVYYAPKTATALDMPVYEKARDVDLDLNYIDVPVLAKFYLPQQNAAEPHVFAGPVASFRVSGKARDANNVLNNENLKDQLRPVVFGVTVGGGIEQFAGGRALSIDARYIHNFTTLFDEADGADVWSRGISFTIGIGL